MPNDIFILGENIIMPKKSQKSSKIQEEIDNFYSECELASLKANKNRARSFTVGTAFGGIVEVSMRGDYHNLWCLLQPVEAVEFIEQLAAATGLQVALRPKQDFATWRGWNIETDKKYWMGSARWQLGEDESNSQNKTLPEVRTNNQLSPAEEPEESLTDETAQNNIEEEAEAIDSATKKNSRKKYIPKDFE